MAKQLQGKKEKNAQHVVVGNLKCVLSCFEFPFPQKRGNTTDLWMQHHNVVESSAASLMNKSFKIASWSCPQGTTNHKEIIN